MAERTPGPWDTTKIRAWEVKHHYATIEGMRLSLALRKSKKAEINALRN